MYKEKRRSVVLFEKGMDAIRNKRPTGPDGHLSSMASEGIMSVF